MLDDEEREAMCSEIAKLIGIKHRRPGWITALEFSRQENIEHTTARRVLNRKVKSGELESEKVLDNGVWCIVYRVRRSSA